MLDDWSNFYVVVGGSAGALTGLMFVVITLRREYSEGAARAVRSFATPTIVHFTTVVTLSALLSMPHLTRATLGVILLVIGALLLSYVAFIYRHSRTLTAYRPDLEDLVFHFILPAAIYTSILVAGLCAWSSPNGSLRAVGGGMLGLLIVGIHNAWDSAVWMIARQSSTGG